MPGYSESSGCPKTKQLSVNNRCSVWIWAEGCSALNDVIKNAGRPSLKKGRKKHGTDIPQHVKSQNTLSSRLQRSERFNVLLQPASKTSSLQLGGQVHRHFWSISLSRNFGLLYTHERHCKSLKTGLLETSVHDGDSENIYTWYIGNDKPPHVLLNWVLLLQCGW